MPKLKWFLLQNEEEPPLRALLQGSLGAFRAILASNLSCPAPCRSARLADMAGPTAGLVPVENDPERTCLKREATIAATDAVEKGFAGML